MPKLTSQVGAVALAATSPQEEECDQQSQHHGSRGLLPLLKGDKAGLFSSYLYNAYGTDPHAPTAPAPQILLRFLAICGGGSERSASTSGTEAVADSGHGNDGPSLGRDWVSIYGFDAGGRLDSLGNVIEDFLD